MKIYLAPLWQGGVDEGVRHPIDIKHSNKTIIDNKNHLSKKKFNLNNYDVVLDYCIKLYNVITNSYSGDFFLTIGGDHSVSLGTVSAISKYKENLSVIWIDAHADSNTPNTTLTGNIHGTILASLYGEGDKKMINLGFDGIKVEKNNVLVFGTRDVDEKEKEILLKNNIKNIPFEELQGLNINNKKKILDYLLNKSNPLHISLDLDALDPRYIPGVSVPVKGGFSKDEVIEIITHLFKEYDVVSMDIVEYNLEMDNNNLTKDFILELIKVIEKNIVKN